MCVSLRNRTVGIFFNILADTKSQPTVVCFLFLCFKSENGRTPNNVP